jgi:hypothetical protein
MIEGVFRDGHPRVVLTVTGENDSVEVEFIVDSGYDGFLSLPSFVLERVGATPENFRTVVLADETEVRTISATVTIEWHDEPPRGPRQQPARRPAHGHRPADGPPSARRDAGGRRSDYRTFVGFVPMSYRRPDVRADEGEWRA